MLLLSEPDSRWKQPPDWPASPAALRWSSMDLPGLQISMIWANAIICMICAGSPNFDSKKLSVRSVEDHLKAYPDLSLIKKLWSEVIWESFPRSKVEVYETSSQKVTVICNGQRYLQGKFNVYKSHVKDVMDLNNHFCVLGVLEWGEFVIFEYSLLVEYLLYTVKLGIFDNSWVLWI